MSVTETSEGYLVLEDKKIFSGLWHGDKKINGVGEVVFNTSMQGYQEIVTDPSYYGQVIVMTTPEQGNYGVALEDQESKQVYAEGFVCVELNNSFTPNRKNFSLELAGAMKPAMSDVDTRALTLYLRTRGTPWGALITASSENEALSKGLDLISQKKKTVSSDWVYEVTVKKPEFHTGTAVKGRVAVFDFGTKSNIVGELKNRFKEVAVFGSRTKAREILDWNPDGVVLTNGPGDPATVENSVGEIKALLGQVPLFGICMGHQLLALAVGGKTFKLKFGHRGANHPVKNLETGEIYMTSQNHGYAVDEDLPSGVKLSQINLYDKTVEGIEIPSKKAWSVQYHPEACPGPHDARKLFDYFADSIKK
jgi:carbamoyl-phosphate synthase small subunit